MTNWINCINELLRQFVRIPRRNIRTIRKVKKIETTKRFFILFILFILLLYRFLKYLSMFNKKKRIKRQHFFTLFFGSLYIFVYHNNPTWLTPELPSKMWRNVQRGSPEGVKRWGREAERGLWDGDGADWSPGRTFWIIINCTSTDTDHYIFLWWATQPFQSTCLFSDRS